MKTTRWIAIVALALVSAGCRTTNNRQLVIRELREQEDQIYELEDQLDDCQTQLCAAKQEIESLRKGDKSADSDEPATRASRTRIMPRPGMLRRRGAAAGPPAGDLDLPEVESGEGSTPADSGAPILRTPRRSNRPDDSAEPGRVDGASYAEPAADDRPDSILINAEFTGPLGQPGEPGAGIALMYEVHSTSGEPVKAAGDVSIVVLDPAESGRAARVARWDIPAAKAASHFHHSTAGVGYHFDLRWPGPTPAHEELHVFVRLTTPDGQKLVADAPLGAQPPARPVAVAAPRSDISHPESGPILRASNTRRERVFGRRRSRDTGPAEPEASDGSAEAVAESKTSPEPPRLDPVEREANRTDRPVWRPYR